MAGRWERRERLRPLPYFERSDALRVEAERIETWDVWVEDEPVNGVREFSSPTQAARARILDEGQKLQRRKWLAHKGGQVAQSRHIDDRLDALSYAMAALNTQERERERTTTTTARTAASTITGRTATAVVVDDLSRWDMWGHGAAVGSGRVALDRFYAEFQQQVAADVARSAGLTIHHAVEEEIKKMSGAPQTTAEVETDGYDFWTAHAPATFNASYIGVTMPEGHPAENLLYWVTDGRIGPRAVARLLSRYYSTSERVALLASSKTLKGAKMLHPDASKLQMTAGCSRHRAENWEVDTNGMKGYAFVFKDNRWQVQQGDGKGFAVIDPHADAEEDRKRGSL